MKFDVVLGNPPYQEVKADGSRKSKSTNLWSKFVHQSFKLVKQNGFVALIIPASWLAPKRDAVCELLTSYQLLSLNVGECKKYFPTVGSAFSYFVVKTTKDTCNTDIVCEYNSVLFKSQYQLDKCLPFLPLMITETALSILTKTVYKQNKKFGFDCSHQFTYGGGRADKFFTKEYSKTYPYEIFHTPSQTFWSSNPHKEQGKLKVVIPITTYYEKIAITTAGVTQGTAYVIVNTQKEAETLQSVLLLKLYRFVANICRWGNWNQERLLGMLPSVDLSHSWTDEELYKYFNLTTEEITLIEETVK